MNKLFLWVCTVLMAGCTATTKEELTESGLKRSDFQTEVNGEKTDLFVLKNKNKMEVCVTNFGGRIVSVMVPDKDGNMKDVVLGFDSIQDYIKYPSDFGASIGRYANRINQGRFTLDGVEYQLPQNNYGHCLHGGPKGFQYRVYKGVQKSDRELQLTYLAKDGEEGFPGNLDITVVYTFTNQNELVLTYTATTDKRTIVNLTHHAFFSLSGLATPTASVENNIVTINADFYTPIDEVSITTGEILKVEGTPMDFRTPHTIGSRINEPFQQLVYGAGYDHNYVINKQEAGTLTFAAKCVEPISGRTLEVYTTEPGVQVYTANWHSGFAGWHGATFPARSAICFEAQHFPDTPNKGHFPSAALNPGEVYHQVTVYKFGIEQ